MILEKYNLSEELHNSISVVIVASRQGQTTTAIGIPSRDAVELFRQLQAPITNKLVELFSLAETVIIDLDSISQNVVRFYIKAIRGNTSKFPFNAPAPDDTQKFLGLGFFVDKTKEEVTQYKHYYIEHENPFNLHNYKFSPDGAFLGEYTERESNGDSFTELASEVDTSSWKVQYSERVDADQKYLILKPKNLTPARV